MTSSAPTMRRTRCRRVSECSAVAFQDRASMDRLRTMKMAAAAGNGDEQARIEGSTAHDPADGNDSFSCESLIFSSQSSAHAVEHRTSKLRRGQQWMASQGSLS